MRVASILLVAVSLMGCGTPYQDMGFAGGVAAAQVSADTYRISARGNGYTASTTIQDYALLKAAETTKAAGGTHFQIVGGRDASRSERFTTSGSATTTFIGRTAHTTYTPGQTVDFLKPGEDAYIRVLRVAPGQQAPAGAILADEIIRFVGSRVKRS